MKKILISLFTFLFFQIQALPIEIPAGTAVVVKVLQEVDADKVKLGENVKFVVAQPVKINGEIAVNAGTAISAKITKKKNNGILGIPGELEIGEFFINDGYNDPIRLSGTVCDKGDGRYWANAGWVFLITLPMVFIKGNDGKINSDKTFVLYTIEDSSYSN